MEDRKIRDDIVDIFIVSAEAQLKALRRIKKKTQENTLPRKRRSNLDMIADILHRSDTPLHINVIIERVKQFHGVVLDRESIVSSLTKKVHRKDRFCRTAPNTFALTGEK
jgi:hypothetical protein